MLSALRPAAVLLLLFTLLTGLAYPLGVTGLAQLLFPDQANGSLVVQDGRVVGSRLIGQDFSGPGWFHGRPSASGYDAAASGGSNLGPTSEGLVAAIRVRALAESQGAGGARVPVDLVTSSASGLDPHISPAAALLQVPRVAATRGLDPAALRALVLSLVESPTFALLGEPRVNVLALNLALARLAAGR